MRILLFTVFFGYVQPICRDSWFKDNPELFARKTCGKCYNHLFSKRRTLDLNLTGPYYLQRLNFTYDPVAGKDSIICRKFLTKDECNKWTTCCETARKCCLLQLNEKKIKENDCPATWDGIACWRRTSGGRTVSQKCPIYYANEWTFWRSPRAKKTCFDNGTWLTHPTYGNEWTDFNECHDTKYDIKIMKIGLYVEFAGQSISISSLLLSIFLIFLIKNLRQSLLNTEGNRLHINLFFAMLFSSIARTATNIMVFDRFRNIKNPADTFMAAHPIWCRLLHISEQYGYSCVYGAMLCEGVYLYKRISKVMQIVQAESLMKYILFTWIFPILTVGTYSIVMLVKEKGNRCWTVSSSPSLHNFQYIQHAPNMIFLTLNTFFLIRIEYILCTKLRSNVSDSRIYALRRALRATFFLIPVFGIQFFFILYTPKFYPPYQVIASIVQSSQGFLVATLYCFTTKEVCDARRRLFENCRKASREARKESEMSMTRLSRLSVDFNRSKKVKPSLPDLIRHYMNRRQSRSSQQSTSSTATDIESETASHKLSELSERYPLKPIVEAENSSGERHLPAEDFKMN